MLGLIQRVSSAAVHVAGEQVAHIGRGILALIAIERDDTEKEAQRLLERLISYRVFPDAEGRMNLSLADTGGGLLLVPQFTLAADTRKGTRASFGPAAPPEDGERRFSHLVMAAREKDLPVAAGVFGAHMEVSLVNDGPVTFLLAARPSPPRPRNRGSR